MNIKPQTEPAPQNGELLLTSHEVAALLAVPESQLVAWRFRTPVVLPFVRVGRFIRYRRGDVDQFVADNLCAA